MTFTDFMFIFMDLGWDCSVAMAVVSPFADELFLVTIDTRTGEVAK